MKPAARPLSFWTSLFAICGFAIWFGWRGLASVQVESNLLDLLPSAGSDREAILAIRQFAGSASSELLFLAGTRDAENTRAAAKVFADALRASPAFDRVEFLLDAGMLDEMRSQLGRRAALLSDRHHDMLARGDVARLEMEAQQAAYTPLGFARPFALADDPLGLAADTVDAPSVNGAARLEDDYLAASSGGRTYALIRARLAGNPYALPVQDQVLSAIDNARAAAIRIDNGFETIASGVVFHAAQGARSARGEIARFGLAGMLAIVALVVVVFRSPWPLLMTLVVLAIATAAAISVCQAVFGNVHVLTLTFGTSLIGVAVDYALHYFAHRLGNPQFSSKSLNPALLLGSGTTIAGYLALLLAPISALRQIALYSTVGLLVSCALVILVLPHFNFRSTACVPDWAQRLNNWQLSPPVRRWLLVAAIVIAAAGLLRIKTEDDVRTLQRPSAELAATEQRVRQILQTGFETQFILVVGASEEEVLVREEAARRRLQPLQDRAQLSSHFAVTQSLPSLDRQADNRKLLSRYVAGTDGALARALLSLGFPATEVARRVAAFEQVLQRNYHPQDWLASSMSEPWRPLWLQLPDGNHASVVLLRGLADVPALKAAIADLPGVGFVDQVGEINALLRHYRQTTLRVLLIVAALVLVILLARYRSRTAFVTALPGVSSVVFTVALLGLLGEPLSLFNTLALLLVLGMGDDYAIFLREDQQAATVLAVVLCGATTMLSFGLLGFSSVPFVRSIGLTIALGIMCALSLSLLLKKRSTQ